MRVTIENILDGGNLGAEQASDVMHTMLDERTDEVAIAALLTAMRARGERPEELAGFARVLLEQARPFSGVGSSYVDTCGTGGDGYGTFNISTATALVCAAAGLDVAKHGNRAASSHCGSADVLEALGVSIESDRQSSSTFTFLFAPEYHTLLARIGDVRRRLRIPTIFNLIGPLANPAEPDYQLVGVSRVEHLSSMASAMLELGRKRALVVHGEPGLDEATPAGPVHILDVRDGDFSHTYVNAADFGLAPCSVEDLKGGDAQTNAAIIEAIFAGEHSPCRDTVVLNVALVLLMLERESSPEAAARAAQAVIDSGDVKRLLEGLRRANHVS